MEPSDENGNTADADEAGGFHIPGWLIPILVVVVIIAAVLVLLIIRVQIIRAKRRRRVLMRRRKMQQMQRRRAMGRRPQGRPQHAAEATADGETPEEKVNINKKQILST